MAVESIGALAQFGVDTVNPVTKRLDFMSSNLICTETLNDLGGLRGTRSHDKSRVRQGRRTISGTVVLHPNAVEWDLLLPWILGAARTGAGPVYTYAVADAAVSRYVEIDAISKVMVYDHCFVDTATFEATEGTALKLTLNLVGVDETIGAAGSFPVLSIDVANGPYMLQDLVLSVAATPYTLKTFRMVINNAIDRSRYLNSNLLSTNTQATDRHVTGQVSMPFSDAVALYNTGATAAAIVGTFTNGGAILVATLANAVFPRKTPPIAGRGEISMPLDFTAYSAGATKEIVITQNQGP